MFKRIKEFFTGKPEVKTEEVVQDYADIAIAQRALVVEAPYKVETVAEKASQAVVESLVPAKKPKAPKKPQAKKVAATKVKPRKPKATK